MGPGLTPALRYNASMTSDDAKAISVPMLPVLRPEHDGFVAPQRSVRNDAINDARRVV